MDLIVGQSNHQNYTCPSGYKKIDSENKLKCKNEKSTNLKVELTVPGNFEDIKKAVSDLYDTVSNKLKKAVQIFTPLIDLIESVDKMNKKITISDLGNVFASIAQEVKKDNGVQISEESKKALAEISKTIKLMKEDEKFKDTDLTSLIKKWRESKNTKTLLEMAECIESDKSCKINDKKLKRLFVEGLKSFSDSLDELRNNYSETERKKVEEKLISGADSLVDGAEVIAKKGSDDKLNKSDKVFIASKLKESIDEAREAIDIAEESNIFCSSFSSLSSWICNFFDFICQMLEEEKEREKKEKERLCEERCEQKKKIKDFHSREIVAKRKKERFYALMEKSKNNIYHYSFMVNMEKSKSNFNPSVLIKTKKQVEENILNYEYAKNKYAIEAERKRYFKRLEDEIRDGLPPSYVCEHESPYNLDLDLIC